MDDVAMMEYDMRHTGDQRAYNMADIQGLVEFEHGREMALMNADTYVAFAIGKLKV
jgi:hypothetical protein